MAMTLGDIGDLATVVALLILVYITAKPTVNRWATVKFLRAIHEATWDDFLTSPPSDLPMKRRIARSRRKALLLLYQRLMTKVHRINHMRLLNAFKTANRDDVILTFNALNLPHHLTQTERELVIEAVALSQAREKRPRTRRRRRSHKGVVCAGRCGTRYGKRRHDHNFVREGGIEGGWFCPSNESCRIKPTGEHYCGMCNQERNAPMATSVP